MEAGHYNPCVAPNRQSENPTVPKPAHTTRRRLLKAALGLAAGGVALGAYGRWVEPTWVQVIERDLPVTGLPPAWDGARVCLMADFHHSAQVPLDYLAGAVRQARALLPDLFVLGGDYLTGAPSYGERVAGLFEKMDAPLGVIACLGNHDYGYVSGPEPQPLRGPMAHVEALRASGVRVLLNEAVRLERSGQALWVAGVEDYWARRCLPGQAMQDVPAGARTWCSATTRMRPRTWSRPAAAPSSRVTRTAARSGYRWSARRTCRSFTATGTRASIAWAGPGCTSTGAWDGLSGFGSTAGRRSRC